MWFYRIGRCGRQHISRSRPSSSKPHLRIARPSLPTVGCFVEKISIIRFTIYIVIVNQPFVTDLLLIIINNPYLSYSIFQRARIETELSVCCFIDSFAVPLGLTLVLLPPYHASIIFEGYGSRFERVLYRCGFGHSVSICGKLRQRQRIYRRSRSPCCSQRPERPTWDHHESGRSPPQAHGGDGNLLLYTLFRILEIFSSMSDANSV